MSESILNAPRLGSQSTGAHDSTTVGGERPPTASELLAAAGIEVGPGLSKKSLGYDPTLGYDDTGSLYRAERDTAVQALLEDSGTHSALLLSPATGLDPKVGLGLGGTALALCLVPVLNIVAALLAVGALSIGVLALRRTHASSDENLRLTVVTLVLAGLAALGSVVSMAAYADTDGPTAGQRSRANGAATGDVLAHDLGVGLGAYTAQGLPVTLTNIARQPLSYNVTVEALDAEGRRLAANVAFVPSLAPGGSTVATLFGTADAVTQVELTGARFRVVEASAY